MQNSSLGFWIPGTNPNEPSLYEALFLRLYSLVSLLGGKHNFKKHQGRGQLLKVSNQDCPQRVVKRRQNGSHNDPSIFFNRCSFNLTMVAAIFTFVMTTFELCWF